MYGWIESLIERLGLGELLAIGTKRQLDMKHRTQEAEFDSRAWRWALPFFGICGFRVRPRIREGNDVPTRDVMTCCLEHWNTVIMEKRAELGDNRGIQRRVLVVS